MEDSESAERMEDDAAIVACKNGDHESFGILVRKYERELMGHALTLVGNREDALDVVQETFVRAFRSLSRFEIGRKFYPYIYGIMRNLCVDRFRRATRERQLQDAVWNTSELNSQFKESDERTRLLWNALGKLSQEDREIIVLKHLEGRKYDEISGILEIARGTVMSRLHRAREKLKEIVLRLEADFADGVKGRWQRNVKDTVS
jgi:RNA polymerase sigma-70 factor (ECF subfamily)